MRIPLGEHRDTGPSVGSKNQQTQLRELTKGFSDWTATDIEISRNVRLDQPVPRSELAIEDSLDQGLSDAICERMP